MPVTASGCARARRLLYCKAVQAMIDLRLFNTLGRREEVFRPLNPGRVTMYVCGPTVYNWAHVGNARPAVVFDVLYRLLNRFYPEVVYVRNVTDVDDKINAAAEREGTDISVVAARYTQSYHADMASLGVLAPTHEPCVTGHIDAIIAMIERLMGSRHAYVAQQHVLFSVNSYEEYGKLSGRNREQLRAGARVEIAPFKRDPADFVLWKPSTTNQPRWDSPWGLGRPGWHIECSALADRYLGETIDIHGGGQDLVFPHHENELAQSTCAHGGKVLCRYWLHNGLVQYEDEKMSKSIGNVRLLRDELKRHNGETLRYAFLATHYRSPLVWSDAALTAAARNLQRLYTVLNECPAAVDSADGVDSVADLEPILAALADDLNTPLALTCLHELARRIKNCHDQVVRTRLAAALRRNGAILGLLQQDTEERLASESAILDSQAIQQLLAARDAARHAHDYAKADRLRGRLLDMGIQVQDLPDGTSRWRRGA